MIFPLLTSPDCLCAIRAFLSATGAASNLQKIFSMKHTTLHDTWFAPYGIILRIVLLCMVCMLFPHEVRAGKQIFITTEKLVYPYPMNDTITVMGYLREVSAGVPVNISVSITLPDGNVTWLNPDMEFHTQDTLILQDFPFVAVPVAKLFETGGSKIFRPGGQAYGDLPAGKYIIRSTLSGAGVNDSSESIFFLVSEELLPSIAETPRPIIDSLDPPWGDAGSVIVINGRNLRGKPDLVDPSLIDRLQIKVTLAEQEIPIVDMDPDGEWLAVRLPTAPLTGDMIVNVTLPYWDMLEPPNHLLIPRVASFPSNAFPFWAAPVITSLGSTDIISGASVGITGRNFSKTSADNQVLFNGVPGTVTASTSTEMTVTVPIMPGTGLVSVCPVSNGIIGRSFTVRLAGPSVTSWYPRTIVPGSTLNIRGSNFSDTPEDIAIYLDGVPLEVLSASKTVVTARTPSNLPQGIYDLELLVYGASVQLPDAVRVVPVW